ncbi:hypothetical protein [Streptomyces sp. NPDC005435]|uniref:hypothetical protein n=1 Tax=Streptomyces sp. NPDC005435 TaxID=3154464 RepID=UPI003455744B
MKVNAPSLPARRAHAVRGAPGAGTTAPGGSRAVGALVAVLCALGISLAVPGPARADSSAGGDLQVAQTLGDRDLTFVLRRVTGLPGPLRVDVLTHRGTAPGTLRLGTVPTGVSTDRAAGASAGTTTSSTSVALGAAPGSYGGALRIDRAGPWELVVDDGNRTARIPFVVPAQRTSPPELTVFAGFVAAGVLILVTLLVAVRARRGGWVLMPAAGVVAALATAVTAALLSASLPAPPEPGREVDATQDNAADPYAVVRPVSGDHSRPPAALTLTPATAAAGGPVTLRLHVSDGSTGLPADDLVVHDGALMHLVVIGPTGRLWHLHPVRTAPGAYEVRLRPAAAGHYAVAAEVARRGGGVQQLRSASGLTVRGAGTAGAGTAGAATGAARAGAGAGAVPDRSASLVPQGPGTRTVDGVRVRLSAGSARAGAASVLNARIGDTATLQPWLGMVGHMIVVGPLGKGAATSRTRFGEAAQGAPVWAHAHSMGGEMGAASMGAAAMGSASMGSTSMGSASMGSAPMGSTSMGSASMGSAPMGSASMGSAPMEMEGHMGSAHDMGDTPTHDMDTMDSGSMSGLMPVNGDSPADETVAAYGPDVSFVYTFPAAGYYRVWIQAERDDAVLTVPYLLRVAPPTGGAR